MKNDLQEVDYDLGKRSLDWMGFRHGKWREKHNAGVLVIDYWRRFYALSLAQWVEKDEIL